MNKKTNEWLPVKLTEEEFYDRSMEFAEVDEKIEQAEEEKKDLLFRIKDCIGGLKSRKQELRKIIIERQEFRDVKCEWINNWESMQSSLVRSDTGEIVRTKTIKLSEVKK